MRYKVGDKVRVRKDLPENYTYNVDGHIFNLKNKRWFLGKTATIMEAYTNYYILDIDDGNNYIDEMLEPVEDIIEYKGKKYDVVYIIDDYDYDGRKAYSLELTEHKEEILDEVEKEYLRNVIKYVIEPTHKKIKSVSKNKPYIKDDEYFIQFAFYNKGNLFLPVFKDKRMYKEMELNEPYTLEELGL